MRLFADDFHLLPKYEDFWNRWRVLKPTTFWTVSRFREAWDVFVGRAMAIYFHEEDQGR